MAQSKLFRVLTQREVFGEDPENAIGDPLAPLDPLAPDDFDRRILEARRAVARLTPRQRQVLIGVLQGNSNKQIARNLGISPRTVEVHREGMMARLDAKSTVDAVRIGIYAHVEIEHY